MDFEHSERAQHCMAQVERFVRERVVPNEQTYADPELTRLVAMARALRIADGPDEVHRGMVARLELRKYL